MIAQPEDVIQFWFKDHGPKDWFTGGEDFDKAIVEKFSKTHAAAHKGELFWWRTSPENRLAEIIVLDQFTRQIYRKDPRAFACDPIALTLAQEMVIRGDDMKLPDDWRSFAYMPYMHSESAAIHELAMQLFDQPGLENNYDFEVRHKAIIDRFGRYPHRNALLGRGSTDEELAFLKEPGSSF